MFRITRHLTLNWAGGTPLPHGTKLEDVHVRGLPFSRPKRGVGIAVSVQRTLRASYSDVCSNYPVILVALRVRLRGSENT